MDIYRRTCTYIYIYVYMYIHTFHIYTCSRESCKESKFIFDYSATWPWQAISWLNSGKQPSENVLMGIILGFRWKVCVDSVFYQLDPVLSRKQQFPDHCILQNSMISKVREGWHCKQVFILLRKLCIFLRFPLWMWGGLDGPNCIRKMC